MSNYNNYNHQDYIDRHRKENYDYDYPIYKQSTYSKLIVKFTFEDEGIVVRGSEDHTVGIEREDWINCTDSNSWKEPDVLIDKDRDLYDKQFIMYWDDCMASRVYGFYDAKNKSAFQFDGSREGGDSWDNIAPIVDVPEWMYKAQAELED